MELTSNNRATIRAMCDGRRRPGETAGALVRGDSVGGLACFLHTPTAIGMTDKTGRVTTEGGMGPRRRWSAGAAAGPTALAAVFLVVFTPVITGMVGTWWRVDNASHGFAIPLIAGYLAWRRRAEVRTLARPWAWGLVVVAFGLLLYPTGVFAGIGFVPELSLVVALGGFMLHFWGPGASRRLAFPYAFLFFMVPWPDTLVEFVSFPMQLFSAKFATMAAGLAGADITRDGVDIHMAGQTFSVGAPCSGMKYAVALTSLAALIAYLAEGSVWKRWVVAVAGPPLALMGNVGRILCVLAIAAIAGPEAATGFFHGFSGVLVFLIAVAGLLIVSWALDLRLDPWRGPAVVGRQGLVGRPRGGSGDGMGSGCGWGGVRGSTYLMPIFLVLLAGGLVLPCRGLEASPAFTPDLSRVPLVLQDWQGTERGTLDGDSLEMLDPDAYLLREYTRSDGYPVDLSILFGYRETTFHSPGFCLLGGGWNILQKSRRSLQLGTGDGEVLANEFLLQRGGEERTVLYWYMSHGATTPSFMQFRYHLLRNRVLRRPTWGALIRVSAPIAGSQEEAAQASEDLLREIHPDLREALKI